MKAIAFALLLTVGLSEAAAQVVGQVSKITKECYVRAGKDASPRALQRGMTVSVGEEVFCALESRVEVQLTNGEVRPYEPRWTVISGVPAAGKSNAGEGFKPHVEHASVDGGPGAANSAKAAAKKGETKAGRP